MLVLIVVALTVVVFGSWHTLANGDRTEDAASGEKTNIVVPPVLGMRCVPMRADPPRLDRCVLEELDPIRSTITRTVCYILDGRHDCHESVTWDEGAEIDP